MKFDHALCLAGLIAFSGALHAESCAGGVGGGMDATGNECNDARWQTDASASVASPVVAPTVAPNAAACRAQGIRAGEGCWKATRRCFGGS